MTALDNPPARWNAETTTAEALQTLRPAGIRRADTGHIGGSRHEPSHGFHDRCSVRAFQVPRRLAPIGEA
jgi:hypothetical protein